MSRKYFASLLVLLLLLSNFSFVTAGAAQGNSNLEKVRALSQQQEVSSLTEADSSFDDTDIVRVIVELSGETPLEYATKKDMLYKELSEVEKVTLETKVEKEQDSVKQLISTEDVNFDYKFTFTTSFNGFSGDVPFGDISKLESIPGVSYVYLANEYNRPVTEPNMDQSHTFIQSAKTWADGQFQGEGMVVAVLDTGVDPDHQDFNITEGVEVALTEEIVNNLLDKHDLNGQYFNEKVPFGYNYFDLNNEVLDLGPHASHHGMHVSGTVAANGVLKGVAPEAQILGMKVFSNDPEYPSTTSDIYLMAIDDSIKLGADVLNMSLGSTASFYDPESAEDVAITRAVDNGIVVSVSAGNSGHIGRSYANPLFQNPDIGVVGAPGLNYDTIQVAASGNVAIKYEHEITLDGLGDFSAVGYGMDSWKELDGFELVDLGEKLGGSLADYEGLDVEGKVVVVPRGGFPFIEKNEVAKAAGAAGIIVRNHDPSAFFFDDQGGWRLIPFMKIQHADGLALQEAIADGYTTLNIEELVSIEGPQMGRMTDFTSWGTTPSLELKPEITAPGGSIYSTMQGDTYGVMSGTSMSAPHVAGGTALVQQYLKTDERFEGYSASERTRLAKTLAMNTAYVIEDLNGQPFSPRRQGAGMMQTYYAVTTPVYVTSKDTGEAKVELYDFTDTSISFTLEATSLIDEEVTYNVDTSVLTDSFREVVVGPLRNALIAGDLIGAMVVAPETITVPANGSVEFIVEIDFSEAKIPGYTADGEVTSMELMEDIFVEGFVTLSSETAPELSVPYLGFYGKWDRPSFLDGLSILDQDRYYYAHRDADGENDVVNERGQFLPAPFTAEDGSKFYGINPYYEDSVLTGINPIPAFLRNTREVQYNVLDADQKLLRRILLQQNVRKNFGANQFNFVADRAWDGKVRGELVADGKYYYEIKGKVDAPGAEFQSIKIPVMVDTTAPEVNIEDYDSESNTVTFSAVDEGVGVRQIFLFVNDNEPIAIEPGETSYTLEEPLGEQSVIEVFAVDKVNNIGFDVISVDDTEVPLIFLTSPTAFGAYNTFEVVVAGYVTDGTVVKSMFVNGEEVALMYDRENNNYLFETTLLFEEEGMQEITLSAFDIAGNEFSIARRVYIDVTKPTISVELPETVDNDVEEIEASILLEDNFHYLSFYINDSHEYLLSATNVAGGLLDGVSKTYETTLSLEEGMNTFEFRLVDYADNVTEKTVEIYRIPASETEEPTNPAPPPVSPPPGPTPEPPPVDEKAPVVVPISESDISGQLNSETNEIVVDIGKNADGKKVVQAEVEPTLLKKIAESDKSLMIQAEQTSLSIPAKVLLQMEEKAGSKKVYISVETLTDVHVPTGQKLLSPAYDYSIFVKELDGAKTKLSKFVHPITVEVTVDPNKAADKQKVSAFYLNDNVWDYVGGKFEDKKFVFKTKHFSTFAIFELNKTFRDISSHWAKDEVEVMASRTIIKGTSEELFDPNANITRAQFAALLTRALGLEKTSYKGTFSDVGGNAWYALEVEAAQQAGIVEGYSNKFSPNANITREEMAVMILRAYEYYYEESVAVSGQVAFTDKSAISSWALEAVEAANELEIVKGRTPTTFAPKDNATRAEAAVMLYRLYFR
ncbi:S8 family serine peptidase [Evansella sp. AB-rgal1]|uniref:S8 family serine peptidase n=1 Tax=Evansella sp. AB-rgal1 TaxID=3242696 RepID=UPI00359CD6BC